MITPRLDYLLDQLGAVLDRMRTSEDEAVRHYLTAESTRLHAELHAEYWRPKVTR